MHSILGGFSFYGEGMCKPILWILACCSVCAVRLEVQYLPAWSFLLSLRSFGVPEYLYPFLCLIIVYILISFVIQWSVCLQISEKALSP